jgi:hypothetical protein
LLLLATLIKYVFVAFSLFLLKLHKLGHRIPSREHWEHNDGTKDKCSDHPPNCRVKRGGALTSFIYLLRNVGFRISRLSRVRMKMTETYAELS